MSAASGAVSGALSAALQSAPALLTYDALRTKYNEFSLPRSVIEFNGKPFEAGNIIVTDINVEATCGFEASVARFRLYNVFSPSTGKFQYDLIQNDVTLGSALTIKLGYLVSETNSRDNLVFPFYLNAGAAGEGSDGNES